MPTGIYKRIKKGEYISCKTCGKSIYVLPCQHGLKKYCSRACQGKDKIKILHKHNLEIGFRTGEESHKWKTGKTINYRGYILVYCPGHPHPSSGNRRYVFEHRLVMEKHLGRYLDPQERVHHIDRNKTNNNIKNLMLFGNSSEHRKYHYKLKPLWSVRATKRIKELEGK